MKKAKWMQLVALTAGSVLALGGCTGGGLLPWMAAAGIVALFSQQTG